MPSTELECLPDFPAVQQIARALWGNAEIRGASVLVGAGFSKNAQLPSPNSAQPPLWFEFSAVLRARLYPGKDPNNAPHDPLKLAQEFEASMGRAALDAVIFELIRDKEWFPGELHKMLVGLPWTDILTTNWDTLLERAGESADQTYETVRGITDIPRSRSPRIVKLHGSMPSNPPFIFTEEDYRTYPKVFAPFVNLVLQVLMENELCLVGFSGDDPNFLEWSGWIRDELGTSARRIYLVGVLDLTPGRRKYLESRNVAPIDLSPAVSDVPWPEKQKRACTLFFDFLQRSQPEPASNWPTVASLKAAGHLADLLASNQELKRLADGLKELKEIWKNDHKAYPGWLVCPSEIRTHIRLVLGQVEQLIIRTLDQLSEIDRAETLYEAAWLFNLVFMPLSESMRNRICELLEGNVAGLDEQQRCELASILSDEARYEGNLGVFSRWIQYQKDRASFDADREARIHYLSALWARDRLDYSTLTRTIPLIKGNDPAWKLRQAVLFCEAGEFSMAKQKLTEALEETRSRFVRDRKSIWSISRHGWALFLIRAARSNYQMSGQFPAEVGFDRWPDYFRANKALPLDEIDALDSKIAEAFRGDVESREDRRPLFDPGSYKTTVRFSSSIGEARVDLIRVGDRVGLPVDIGNVMVMRSRLLHILALDGEKDEADFLLAARALGSTSDRPIENLFDRIRIARLSEPKVNEMVEILWKAISFGREKYLIKSRALAREDGEFWGRRLPVFIDILSRFVIRLTGEKAIETFHRAVSLANGLEPEHWHLFEPLRDLMSRSWVAIAPKDREGLLTELLEFPLPIERGIRAPASGGPQDMWPDPFASPSLGVVARTSEVRFSARVLTLISRLRDGDVLTRTRAAIRLLKLYENNALGAQEVDLFEEAVWVSGASASGLPNQVTLYSFAAFRFPGAEKHDVESRFRRELLEKGLSNPVTGDLLMNISGATAKSDSKRAPFKLTSSEAIKLSDMILNWKPRQTVLDLDNSLREIQSLAGTTFAQAVFPVLTKEEFGKERFDQFMECVKSGRPDSLVLAIPDAIALDKSRANVGVELIRKAIFDRRTEISAPAIGAILRWLSLADTKALDAPPEQLKNAVCTIVATANWTALYPALRVAVTILTAGLLNKENLSDLTEALERLEVETAYEARDLEMRAITLSLVRTECVRLARALRDQSGIKADVIDRWIACALRDPIPEVRYALESSGDRESES